MVRRRSLRLLEKEFEKAKKARMSSPSAHDGVWPPIQDSPLFTPEMVDILPKIINNLDPCSFVKFVRTCRDIHDICFNSKGIRIPYDNQICIDVDKTSEGFTLDVQNEDTKTIRSLSDSSPFLKTMTRMPFVYTISVYSKAIDGGLLNEIRQLLRKFPHFRIDSIVVLRFVQNWEQLAKFIQDFPVDSLFIQRAFLNNKASREDVSIMTTNLNELKYDGLVDDDLILNATTTVLRLSKTKMSKETFLKLCQKYVAGDIEFWYIKRQPPADEREEALVEALSEVMPVVQVDSIDESAMAASVIYFTPEWPDDFHLLKADGTKGCLFVTQSVVQFGESF